MTLKFTIDYRTQYGQSLYLCGSSPELGAWNPEKAIKMIPESGENWSTGSIKIKSIKSLTYKYFVKDDQQELLNWEFGTNRLLELNHEEKDYFCRDFWRSFDHFDNVLYTSPFHKAFFKRPLSRKKVIKYQKTKSYVRLQLRAPRLGKGYSIGILGNNETLGNWDQNKVVLLSDHNYPVWQTDIPLMAGDPPFEYKYVIYSNKEKKVVTWEGGDNRYFPSYSVSNEKLIVHSDENFNYPVGNWKAAGVAIPVFSLRSKRGAGVGEFPDLKLLVDWAVKTQMKIVQILPVNDTIATHTWIDSYPYAAISVHALHPIFGNMDDIGKLKDKKTQSSIQKSAKALNELKSIDYEAVLELKSRFYKQSFEENKIEVLNSEVFKAFIQQNGSWIHAYAAFSYLRDKYKTPDFSQWGKQSTMSEKQLKTLVSPKSAHYDDIAVHYYIQFYLDKQLKEVSEYARSKGVVLKGDIPIGIYRHSVDAWLKPSLFNMDCQSGAPPDGFAITGQNWGFPPYNWEEMAKDGYKWWNDRMVKMADYFDIFRIDHILGFFRIWEIEWQYTEGIMGRFNPSLPIHQNEFSDWGIDFDKDRFCKPYIRTHMIYEIFGNHAEMVFHDYLKEYAPGCYEFHEDYNSQRKIKEHFDLLDHEDEFHSWLKTSLNRLHSEVLFMEAPLSNGEAFNPRISFHSTYSYNELDAGLKSNLDRLYIHFFYKKHNEFWRNSAMMKLPMLKNATDMLICGEDLGMVPESVPGVMNELQILSLAIQRMPNDDREFWHPSDTPYLSVTTTGSHDLSTLREWWQEDVEQTQKFYSNILGNSGGAPYFCEPWIVKDILNQHFYSPSMLAIIPLQDLLGIDGRLRVESPEEERINVPAIAQHYWKYRFHISLEDLVKEESLNTLLRQMIDQSGRSAAY